MGNFTEKNYIKTDIYIFTKSYVLSKSYRYNYIYFCIIINNYNILRLIYLTIKDKDIRQNTSAVND